MTPGWAYGAGSGCHHERIRVIELERVLSSESDFSMHTYLVDPSHVYVPPELIKRKAHYKLVEMLGSEQRPSTQFPA